MRFLHTADWHIGKGLHGLSRLDEQERMIHEVIDIASRERVDCLLFSGDLYDSFAPAADAERLVFYFLSELAARRIRAVVIGGNHDHPMRLAAVRPILDHLKIAVCPQVVKADKGGVLEFAVEGERARIALLPWVWAAKLTLAEDALGNEGKLVELYLQRMNGMIEQMTAGFTPDAVNILMAHLYIQNAELSPGAERAICTSQAYAVSAQSLPGSASYIALGHLHRPQEIAAPSPTFYCGSPMQLDFGEQGQAKRVVIIDAKPGIKAKTASIPLTSSRRLQDARGTLAELAKRADEWRGDLLRVTVELTEPQLGIGEKVREILPDAVQVLTSLPRKERSAESRAAAEPQLGPEELFARYYAEERGATAPDALRKTFAELYQEATGASS